MTITQSMQQRSHCFGDDWQQTQSGIYVPSEAEPIDEALPLAVELFAGAGGMSCGFHQAGWHVIFAAEYNLDASMTYLLNLGSPDVVVHFDTEERRDKFAKKCGARKGDDPDERIALWTREFAGSGWISHFDCHRPDCQHDGPFDNEYLAGIHARPPHDAACEHFYVGDVATLTGAQVLDLLGMDRGDLDCVAGGPPCQGFSMANMNREPDDPRNQLVFEFARLVCELNPKTMVMENVPAILTMRTPEGVLVVDALARVLADGGFSTYDAMRKTLRAQATGGLLRDDSLQASTVEPEVIDDPALALFDMAATGG